jgi:hypothetical protein
LPQPADQVQVPKKAGIKCYNCTKDGHYQSACQFPAHCGVCNQDGHTTGMCPQAPKPPSLQWYGYAVDGRGFHCLEVEEALLSDDLPSREFEGTVIAMENRLDCDALARDLKALIDENWDWQVRRVSDTDFAVVFPTQASLNLCKNLCKNAGGITLPISKISVLFVDPVPYSAAAMSLAKIWVRLSGVPQCLRKIDLLMEGTKMLGRPRLADEESLPMLDLPVRMLFHSHDPDHLPKSVMLFANLKGFKIGVEVEMAKGLGGPSRRPDDNDDNDDKGDDGDERAQTEDQSQSDRHWKRQPSSNKDKGKVGADAEQVMQRGGVNQACLSPLTKTPSPQPLPAKADEVIPPVLVYGKNPKKRPGSKSSVGSSSVPLPSAKDFSASKPASAPAKSQLSPIPFDQYGSNLDADLLGAQNILEPKALSMTIILDEDSPPSDPDADPSVLKRSKLSEADRADIG